MYIVRALLVIIALLMSGHVQAQGPGKPIVDVHLHAFGHDAQGPYPSFVCAPYRQYPVWEQNRGPYGATFSTAHNTTDCGRALRSQPDDESLMRRTIEVLEANNVFAITGGSLEYTERWHAASPYRIMPALHFRLGPRATPPAEIQALYEARRIHALSEVTLQYQGIEPDDPRFEPWLAKLEEIDLPLGIHIGTGPPGAPYLGSPEYRARFHSPLSLEEPLLKYPGLRVYVMHAGWPMLDDTLALLWTHPQVYLGLGVIDWGLPPAEFHRYLKALVDAGFGNRIMFGSDQMVWPETIEIAIENIQGADYLSDLQKRDIFYNNAARFFRFDDNLISQHHDH
mgnify:CR=1 FL=1